MKKTLTLSLLTLGIIGLVGAGTVSAHGWFMGASPEEMAERQSAIFTQHAEMLGITQEQYIDGWAEGKNMMEIAEEYGITQEELQEKMQKQRKAQMQERIQAMVDNGVISQKQADQRLQFMEENGFRGGFGGRGGFRPMRGEGCQFSQPAE